MTSLDLSKRPEDGQPQPVRPAAGSTRAKALQALSGALEIAIDLGAIDANPCRKVSAGRQARRAVETLTPAELAGLAAAAGKRDEAMVWALGTCGIRIGEACALDVGDVDVRRRRLMVRKAKDGEPREVPIPESVLGRLALKGRDRSEPLFLSPAGKRIDPHNWRPRVFDKAAKRIGRPDITPHVLRHTAASLAIRSGADVKAVQRMLGHATAKLTLDTYGHLWDAGLDDVATRMDGLIGGGDG
nr:site-specific integrase [Brooklawnia cerclae]